MATLFKPTRPYPLPPGTEIVRKGGRPHARIPEKGRAALYPLSADGAAYLKPAAKWAADVRFADGTRKRVRFSPNRDAAALMLAELLKRIENEKAGVIDRTASHRKRPLSAHLDDWRGSLAASGRGEEYLTLKLSRVRAVVEGCGWTFTPDMTADRLEAFLLDLRVKVGRSIQTANDWLQAVRQFCRWMVANDRLDRDPFARLKPGNVKLDQRHRRGEFTPDELARLLRAAASSPVTFRRTLTGADRVVYRVALGTGFRAAELAALVPDNFDLAATPPAIALPPEFSKNRRGAIQPIPADLAADLRAYLRGRPGKESVWPGTWADRSADMLKIDLTAAGVPSEVDGPEGVEVRDFHALRNCFISDVLRAGADLKQAMTLARHSDPRLTTARYGRTRLHDLGAVVDKIPTPTRTAAEPAVLRLTGTDSGSSTGAATGAAASGSGRVRLRTIDETDGGDGRGGETKNPPVSQGFEDDREQSGTIRAERAGFEPAVGFYPHAALAKRLTRHFAGLTHLEHG